MNPFKKDILILGEEFATEQLNFLVEVCNCNSYSYNKKGLEHVASLLTQKLKGILQLHYTIQEKDTGNHYILKTNTAQNKPSIYLIGHMDTVFPPEYHFQECQIDDNRLIGPGSGDMKGGLVVFVYALKILNQLGILEELPITMIMNSDEEIGSKYSKSIFLEERNKAILCLTGECAGPNNEIVISRNGKMGARIDCYGQGRHVGQGAAGKASAIVEIAHKIIKVETLNGTLPGVDINIGQIEGGLASNTVPENATCFLDVRWRNEEQKEIFQNKISEIVIETVQSGCRSTFEIMNHRPAMPETPQTAELVPILRKTAKKLNYKMSTEHRRGTSDANFFGSVGIPTLDGWGPIGYNDHTDKEYISISSLKERTILLTTFLVEYAQQAGLISKKR